MRALTFLIIACFALQAQTAAEVATMQSALQDILQRVATSLGILQSSAKPVNWRGLVSADMVTISDRADLVRQTGVTTLSVTSVKAGDDLQAALNAAKPGDTLALQAGASFVGNFVLPAKSGIGTITITSSAVANLPAGRRVKPTDAIHMPKIISPNAMGALTAAPRSHDYMIVGIEATSPVYNNGLLRLGNGGETLLSDVPANITLERSYIHANARNGGKRGVQGNARGFVLRDSYVSDWKSDGQDAQAFYCWNCDHVLLENNYLEGSGENVFIGEIGSVKGYVPYDIIVRRNHIRKPLSWFDGTDVAPSGKHWIVKNLFELKAGIQVRVYENILENNWESGQAGAVFVLKPGNAPVVNVPRTEDVIIERNLAIGGLTAANITGNEPGTTSKVGGPGVLKNVTIRHNAFVDMGAPKWGREGRVFQLLSSPANSVVIENNTITGHGFNYSVMIDGVRVNNAWPVATGFVFRNNILPHGTSGVKATGMLTGSATVSGAFVNPVFTGNVFVHPTDLSKSYPPGNLFVPSIPFAADEFTQSVYPGIGVDATALKAAIASVP